MVTRSIASLLVLAALVCAQESAKDVYKELQSKRGDEARKYAEEKGAALEATAKGKDLAYLGMIWMRVDNWEKVLAAFDGFLSATKAGDTNRSLALAEKVHALVELRRHEQVPDAAKAFLSEFPGTDKNAGRVHWYHGRALRGLGKLEEALAPFKSAAAEKHEVAPNDVVDTYIQLGIYDKAKEYLESRQEGEGNPSTHDATVLRMLTNLGKPWPEINFDHWAGTSHTMEEMRGKVTLLVFWSTKANRTKDVIHRLGSAFAKNAGDNLLVFGPTIYTKFDPVDMKDKAEATAKDEQGWVDEWVKQYQLPYSLCLVADSSLHTFCGVDPEKPLLPAFAVGDKKGNLRYFRLGAAQWDFEAIDGMVRKLISE